MKEKKGTAVGLGLRLKPVGTRGKHTFGRGRAWVLAMVSAGLQTGVVAAASYNPATGSWVPEMHWWLLGTLYGLLFWTVYAYNFALIRQGLGFKALLVAGGAGSLLIAAGATAGQRLVEGWLYGGSAGGFLFTMSMNTSPALIAFLVSMLLAGGHLREEEQAENERLRAENEHMRSHTLEQQLAPHFLFNTLSTLEGLTASGDTRAPHYVRRLAEVYRYSLRHAGRSTLREEMDFVHAYVELMGVRYGKALRVVEELDEKLLGREVPAVSV